MTRKSIPAIIAFLILLPLVPLWQAEITPVHAETSNQGLINMEVKVGFDDFFKQALWTPVRVTISNDGPDVEGQIEIRDKPGNVATSYHAPVSLPMQSRKQYVMYVPLDTTQPLEARLLVGGKAVLKQQASPQQLDNEDVLVCVISSSASTLNFLAGLKSTAGGRVAVAHVTAEDLPEQPGAWEGIDVLVINSTDTSHLSGEQVAAMQTWVSFGGHLVVTGGPNAAGTASGIAHLLPVQVTGTRKLDDLDVLESLEGTPIEEEGPFVAAEVSVSSGSHVLIGEEAPILVRRIVNLGTVDYLVLDLNLAPLNAWQGNDGLWSEILSPLQPIPQKEPSGHSWQEMYNALLTIKGAGLPSPLLLLPFLVLYVFALGPANYLIARLTKRNSIVWFTIPLIIVTFSCIAYGGGFVLRGGRPTLSRISIVWSSVGSPVSHVRTFIGIHSPSRATYTAGVGSESLLQPMDYIGNLLYSGTVVTRNDTGMEISGLRSDIGGMPAFVVNSYIPTPDITADLETDYMPNGSVEVKGTITNNTANTVEDAILIWGGAMVSVGDIKPGKNAVNVTLTTFGGQNATYLLAYGQGNTPDDSERRNKICYTIFGYSYMQSSQSIGAGMHLVGWQYTAYSDVTLQGASNPKDDTLSLLIMNLDIQDAGTVLLNQDELAQTEIEQTGVVSSYPGNTNIRNGSITWQYQLPLQYRDMQPRRLTVFLEGWGNGIFQVYFFDWENETWNLEASDSYIKYEPYEVETPEAYINRHGLIRMKVETTGDYSFSNMNLNLVLASE